MLCEKHRPQTFEKLVGRDAIIATIKAMIASQDGIPHLLFHGPSGCGKTTIAHIIANEIFQKRKNENFFEFNASDERGIDVVRDKVIEICKRRPVGVKYRIILMDEADHITGDAQACFRRVFETYHATTRFIWTANYPYKIIPPLLSRFTKIECPRLDVEVIARYLKQIVRDEKLSWGDSDIVNVAKKSNGDLRAALNTLEGSSNSSVGNSSWEQMTMAKLSAMCLEERVNLAFQGNPEEIYQQVWEMIQREKAWRHITLLADCQARMNHAAVKVVFLANLLEKLVDK